jgi:hypothetical protein
MASKVMDKRRAKQSKKQWQERSQAASASRAADPSGGGDGRREGERGREREREGDLYHLTRLVRNSDKVHTLEHEVAEQGCPTSMPNQERGCAGGWREVGGRLEGPPSQSRLEGAQSE